MKSQYPSFLDNIFERKPDEIELYSLDVFEYEDHKYSKIQGKVTYCNVSNETLEKLRRLPTHTPQVIGCVSVEGRIFDDFVKVKIEYPYPVENTSPESQQEEYDAIREHIKYLQAKLKVLDDESLYCDIY